MIAGDDRFGPASIEWARSRFEPIDNWCRLAASRNWNEFTGNMDLVAEACMTSLLSAIDEAEKYFERNR